MQEENTGEGAQDASQTQGSTESVTCLAIAAGGRESPARDVAVEGQGRLGTTRPKHSNTMGNQHSPTRVAVKP